MFKNYFKTAFRSLLRHKGHSFINIIGLTVGFAAFLLIFLVIGYEQSFDDFHVNKNNLYRVTRVGRSPVNPEYRTGVPFPVTMGLRTELPKLKNTTAIFGDANVQVQVTAPDGSVLKKFREPAVFTAEPQFFQMFSFSLAEGNAKSALSEPKSVLLTKDVAAKYFGDWKQAMDKAISLYGMTMKVTGILNNLPSNTDFPLSIVVSYVTLTNNLNLNDWNSIDDANYCFVQLNDKASYAQITRSLDAFTDKHIKPVNDGYKLVLQRLNTIHSDERFGNFNGRTFSSDLVFALRLIGVFLLVIACVNFINLTTAQAVNRAREVGVRKVLGGNRSQLVLQFLSETGIITLLALAASIGIVFCCVPLVNNFLLIHLSTSLLFSKTFLLFIAGSWVAVTFLSGFYPALILSAFKPVNVLKSLMVAHTKGISFRRTLVVFQFVIAQALIIGTLVVASQMDYFRSADMGFAKDAVINAAFPGDSLSRTKIDVLRNELNKIPGVQNVSFSTFTPSSGGGWFSDMQTDENNSNKSVHIVVSGKPADAGYFNLYQLPLVAGRAYFSSDTTREFVLNETAVKSLGFTSPAGAIGRMIIANGKRAPVVGVVKDFHANSLRDPIGPIVLFPNKSSYSLTNIKINIRQAKSVIAAMQKAWNQAFPDYVFEYSFLDQSIAGYYQQENQLSQLYKLFSAIAIFISCLGLYGLISFMAVQRRKEIGIRKVLGAPVRDVVVMLSKEFTFLIMISFVIASPVAWYFMQQWLQQYTYRIMLGAGFFISTIFGSLLIAWLTVGYTAIRAALANPVKSLRTE